MCGCGGQAHLICVYSSVTVRGVPWSQGVPRIMLSLQPTVSMSASIQEPGADQESLDSACWASTRPITMPQLFALLQNSTSAELARPRTSSPAFWKAREL